MTDENAKLADIDRGESMQEQVEGMLKGLTIQTYFDAECRAV